MRSAEQSPRDYRDLPRFGEIVARTVEIVMPIRDKVGVPLETYLTSGIDYAALPKDVRGAFERLFPVVQEWLAANQLEGDEATGALIALFEALTERVPSTPEAHAQKLDLEATLLNDGDGLIRNSPCTCGQCNK